MKIDIIKGTGSSGIKRMGDMKPLEVAEIIGQHYKGEIVMRTASLGMFEVMSLSRSGPNRCWTSKNIDLKVRIIEDVKLTVHI